MMVGGKVHHGGNHGFDVGQIVHVNAPTCRLLSSVAELAPTTSAFVVGGEPGADVGFDPVPFVVGLDAEQQRKLKRPGLAWSFCATPSTLTSVP